jgi:hypothetical protein
MNAIYTGPDYSPVNMSESLSPEECQTVKSFLQALVKYRSKVNVKASKFMHIYRKDLNGAYFSKKKVKGTS